MDIWGISERYIMDIWEISGQYLRDIWGISGKFTLPGSDAREVGLDQIYLSDIWGISGRYLCGDICGISGGYVGNIWGNLGYMILLPDCKTFMTPDIDHTVCKKRH